MAVKVRRSGASPGEAKPKHLFKASPHKEEIKQLLRDGIEVEGKTPTQVAEELATRFGLEVRTIFRYKKEIEDEKAGKVAESKPGSTTRVAGQGKPTELAVITTRTPAPIVFVFGDVKIDVNPLHFLDAWRYCEDIKRIEPSIDDDFALMLKVSVKRIWEEFSHREAKRLGVALEIKEEES